MKNTKYKILIVDDTPNNVMVLSEVLMEEYELSVAMNGQEALDLVKEGDTPDLILLDIMMPEMDGYEVCRRLKADAKTSDIPVIFVTAKSEVDDETKGFEMGAVDFIAKPLSPPIVLARVRSTLRLKQAHEELGEAYGLVSSSINYASKIQRSILPVSETLVDAFTDHFTLWEPRDHVGGDIYFYKPWGGGNILALGDCTGHGVPGAFMTLIVHGSLERALMEVPEGDVAGLLQRTHQHIQTALSQQRMEGDSDDGIEMGICYLAEGTESMVYGGARFSLFTMQNGSVSEIKGDRSGMGYRGIPFDVEYTNHDVPLADGYSFYMTSDGVTDQVGGERRRGFGKKRFCALLESMHTLPLVEQMDAIKTALEKYQGDEKRRDDVAVVGFVI